MANLRSLASCPTSPAFVFARVWALTSVGRLSALRSAKVAVRLSYAAYSRGSVAELRSRRTLSVLSRARGVRLAERVLGEAEEAYRGVEQARGVVLAPDSQMSVRSLRMVAAIRNASIQAAYTAAPTAGLTRCAVGRPAIASPAFPGR